MVAEGSPVLEDVAEIFHEEMTKRFPNNIDKIPEKQWEVPAAPAEDADTKHSPPERKPQAPKKADLQPKSITFEDGRAVTEQDIFQKIISNAQHYQQRASASLRTLKQ